MIRSLPRVWRDQCQVLNVQFSSSYITSLSLTPAATLQLGDVPCRTTLRLFWQKGPVAAGFENAPTILRPVWAAYPIQQDDVGTRRMPAVFNRSVYYDTIAAGTPPQADAYEMATAHKLFQIDITGAVGGLSGKSTQADSFLVLAVESQPDELVSVEEWEAAYGSFRLSAPPTYTMFCDSGTG